MLHGGDDPVTEVGAGAMIGHLCGVHGCTIGTETLLGNGAVVQDDARWSPQAYCDLARRHAAGVQELPAP